MNKKSIRWTLTLIVTTYLCLFVCFNVYALTNQTAHTGLQYFWMLLKYERAPSLAPQKPLGLSKGNIQIDYNVRMAIIKNNSMQDNLLIINTYGCSGKGNIFLIEENKN